MAAPRSLALELKVHTPDSSGNHHRRGNQSPLSHTQYPSEPSVHPPASELCCLRCATEFQNSKLGGFPKHRPTLFLWGFLLLCFSHLLAVQGKWLHNRKGLQSLWQNRAKTSTPAPCPQQEPRVPVPGNSAACWCHPFFLRPRGSLVHAVTPGTPPQFAT